MMHFIESLLKASIAILAIACVGLLLGFPPKWVAIISFVVLDFAGIAGVGQGSFPDKPSRGKRVAPLQTGLSFS